MSQEFNQWVETFRRANNGYLPSPLEVYEHLQSNPHLLREDELNYENEPNTDFVPQLEIKKTINKKVVINKIFKEKENNHSEDTLEKVMPERKGVDIEKLRSAFDVLYGDERSFDEWLASRNNSKDLRQSHTFKPGDKVRVVSNEASRANERCGPHEFRIGEVVELMYWSEYSKSWQTTIDYTTIYYIDPADIEPIK
jgi:hypothetical protein